MLGTVLVIGGGFAGLWAAAGTARALDRFGAAPGDAEVIHQDREHRCVTCLTGTDEDDQRETAPVDEMMDLRAQSAS